ncbi:YtoQ family protein [Colwellia piezophila]|uniref:YtoQ family protein n=1 Tax=Colwellia piezophila TaxID=211668 RepID=UPI00036777E1|nr:YtoQ family protein [Colwellia piezophila]
MKLNVYLSGEIHSDWREKIIQGCQESDLDISFTSANTDHESSDCAGDHLGAESEQFWRDHKSAKVNAMRIKTLIQRCDIAVIRFGEKYKQWNAAFDAGYCAALDKPYITLHSEDIIHPLKEVDASAQAWTTNVEQVITTLKNIAGKS